MLLLPLKYAEKDVTCESAFEGSSGPTGALQPGLAFVKPVRPRCSDEA